MKPPSFSVARVLLLFAAIALQMSTGLGARPHPSTLTALPPNSDGLHAASTRAITAGVAESDWSRIREAYEGHRHTVVPVTDRPAQWRARNPGQQWTTRFDGRGFLVEPDGAAWTWGLELLSYGAAGHEQNVGPKARVRTESSRVTYAWDARLDEWFVNDRRGLEHGFTVHERPIAGRDPLTLRLAVRGGLRPQIQSSGQGVAFLDERNTAVVHYTGLKVFDADQRTLAARFEPEANALRLVVDDEGARYPLTIDPIAQQAYLKGADTTAGDNFGAEVAISGDTLVVTAPRHGEDPITFSTLGAVYVFTRSAGVWSEQARLIGSNTEGGDGFGATVAISGDTVVVGASNEASAATGVNGDQTDNSVPGVGAAYVFTRVAGVWSQQAYLKASNTPEMPQFGRTDQFGHSVAVSGDTIVVGAIGEGSAAIGVNGDQTDNSVPGAGAAYVFFRSGGVWSQQAYLKASNTEEGDDFGENVAISDDTVVVAADEEDSNATGVNGDQANNDAPSAGAAYVFIRSGGVWSQQAFLKASNTEAADRFGEASIAVSGDTIVVSAWDEDSNATGVNGDQANNDAPSAGAAYVFVRNAGTWSQQAYLKASNADANDTFGESVAISGDAIVIGTSEEGSIATGINGNQTDNSVDDAGAAYLFTRNAGVWSQRAYLKASNTNEDDQFGSSVAISDNTVVSGAPDEDSAATGVNGNQADNSASQAGAAYVFALDAIDTHAITFNFTGTISSVPEPLGGGPFSVGQTVSGSYTFNPVANDQDPSSVTGVYENVIGFDVSIPDASYSGSAFVGSKPGQITILNNQDGVRDRYVASMSAPDQNMSGPSVAGADLTRLAIVLRDQTTLAFSSDALPLSPPSLSDFAFGTEAFVGFEGNFGTVEMSVSLTSLTASGTGTMTLTPATLNFAGTNTGGTLNPLTPPQTVTVAFANAGSPAWSASANEPWVQLTGASGTGSGSFTVGIINPGGILPTSVLSGQANLTATITLTAPGVSNSVQTITVNLSLQPGSTFVAPIGLVDTPLQNTSGAVGAIAVTGWVVDDVGIANVQLFRNCLAFEPTINCQILDGQNVVFIGDATLVPGARPDIEALFPAYPNANVGAWGYLLLTSMLPHIPNAQMFGGQGPLTLYIFATDLDGHRKQLGRTQFDTTPTQITMANDAIAKPFGAIDTPGQGATVNGTFANFGWALTPDGNTVADLGDITVPTTGSTMSVLIDGTPVGTVSFNQCRGMAVSGPVPGGAFCDDDVSNIFGNPTPQAPFTTRTSNPTRHRNLDAGRGPIGAFILDTTTVTNGIHTIMWVVFDDAGRGEGIGSRFFNVLNGSSLTTSSLSTAATVTVGSAEDLSVYPVDAGRVWAQQGFTTPREEVWPDATGRRAVRMPAQGRLEVALGHGIRTGYLVANGTLRALPPGSRLDPATGLFTWHPVLGYLGTYDVTFLRDNGTQVPLSVTLEPDGTAAGHLDMAIDRPAANATVGGAFTVEGWALDTGAWQGAGIGAVHVWAQRVDVPAAAPEFLGAAALNGNRSDVAAIHGTQFDRAGWALNVPGLEPGTYDVTAYVWRTRTQQFEDARTVRITVR
jgi:hypothetical protein